MKVVVIDASVAIKWFVREPGTDEPLRRLKDETSLFIAPAIFQAEVINGLLRQHRKGALTDDLLDMALLELDDLLPQLEPARAAMERAIGIARRLRHPIYDCLYLALAERWGTVFVTADLKFVTLCRTGLVDDPIVQRLRILGTTGAP